MRRGAVGSALVADPAHPPRFDDLPADRLLRAFGVEYAHVRPDEGGDLYVTRFGWPDVASLLPERWWTGEWYAREGVRLPGSTGTVYRVRTRAGAGRALDLVVKFSRVAQEISVMVDSSFPERMPPEVLAEARFNSPLEEFGLVKELRGAGAGTPPARLLTQRPLAIYAPSEEFDLWQLGRTTSSFQPHRLLLAADQDDEVKAIELDIKRMYVLLYGWIGGLDAEDAWTAGLLSEEEFRALTPRVVRELSERGFRVLDNKPKHFILRPRSDGRLLRRRGELVYGLVDFELLQRTAEHQQQFRSRRQQEYWRLQSRPPEATPEAPRTSLRPVRLFGVDYLYGRAPDGGRLWVVGRETRLFDFFLPDRWRRTPRVKLSIANEVYRTRTRDNVDMVYRRSRLGLRPNADPLTPQGKAIREGGFNSPFEEIAVAERLREMGVPATRPRAVYQTAHRSLKVQRLRDARRFTEHAALLTPDEPPEPVLSPDHDYYVVWDTYAGPADGPAESERTLALERACEDGLVSAAQRDASLGFARERLTARGLPAGSISDDEYVVHLGPDGAPRRVDGVVELTLVLDALTAHEYGLLDEHAYLRLLDRFHRRLGAVDFEKLDPGGRDLLVTLDSEGRFRRDAAGEVHAALCDFSLVRGLYRPLR